jgi:lambda repressor-like predicted transcriptional regulator
MVQGRVIKMKLIELLKDLWSQINDRVNVPQTNERTMSTPTVRVADRKRVDRTGLKPQEIKAEIMRRGLSLTSIAAEADCTLPEISMCITGYRIYPRIRRIIASRLGKPVERIFGRHHPQPKRRDWCKTAQSLTYSEDRYLLKKLEGNSNGSRSEIGK